MKTFKSKLVTILLIVAVVMVVSLFMSLFMDYIQFKEIGANYTGVFFTNLKVQLTIQSISFAFIFFLLLINAVFIRKNFLKIDEGYSFLKNFSPIVLSSFIMAFIGSSYIKGTVYSRYLLFANQTNWMRADPIFHNDIGYYIFQRPFLMSLIDSVFGILIFAAILTAAFYILLYLRLGITNVFEILRERSILIHTTVNIIILILIRSISYKFIAEDILYSQIHDIIGAGYTNINVWITYYRIAPFVLLAVSIVALFLLYRGATKRVGFVILIYPLMFIAFLMISSFVQNFVVKPNEVVMESPYIKYNLEFTKMAYGLENIVSKPFEATNDLTYNDVKGSTTVDNIRIIDFAATLKANNQKQGLKDYYSFLDTDVNIVDQNGKKTGVFIAAREILKENLSQKNYITDKIRFTHGYGVVINPMSKVEGDGQPTYFVKDTPLKYAGGVKEIKQPGIYYGESADDYVVVGTQSKEIDYSEGGKDFETTYTGKGGVSLNGFNRLLFSIYKGDFQMLISPLITGNSKVLINKNVTERVKKVAPFLILDSDPYITPTDDGKLKWVIDGYTASKYFPYAQYTNDINYIRNSVKAVVDAYDGTVELYIFDKTDPIIKSYQKIYPTLFKTEPIPDDIRRTFKYPESLFNMQRDIYGRYHVDTVDTFYNNSNVWDVAKEIYGTENKQKPVDSYYNLMNIEDSKTEEMVLMTSYTPRGVDKIMTAWLAGRVTEDNKLALISYKTPSSKTVDSPLQIEYKWDSDVEISKEMSLLKTGGSNVIRGNLLVIPIKNSLLYVEPVYVVANSPNAIPELKRVAVAFGDKVAFENTLEDSLYKLFAPNPNVPIENNANPNASVTPNTTQTPGTQDNTEMKRTIREGFAKVKDALKGGNWEDFGKALKEFETLINNLS